MKYFLKTCWYEFLLLFVVKKVRYKVTGHCIKCGKCCQDIRIKDADEEKDFKLTQFFFPMYRRFVIKGKDENGDLYYCLARIYKYIGELEEYYENLKNALKNPYTLTFDKNIVKNEFEIVKDKLGKHESIEPETTVEEYESDDGISEENEDFDEDKTDGIENDTIEEEISADEYEEEEDFKNDEELTEISDEELSTEEEE